VSAYSKFAYGVEPVRRAAEDASASATTEIVAAVPGKKIVVLSFAFVCGDTGTDATFKSGTTAISPIFPNAANGGAVLGHNPLGWCETEEGEALNLTLGAGSVTGVLLNYVLA
jgi:hypothetical protein